MACSQSGLPAGPSPSPLPTSAGATINGLVNGVASSTGKSMPAAATTSALTVTVEGTGLSVTVDASGHFQLAGVPSGDVRLRFSGGGIDAAILVANVGQDEQIQLHVSITGATAVVVSEVRSASKVELCHKTDTGEYHLIEVSTSAEPAHRAHGDGKVGDPVPGAPTKVFSASCQPVGVGLTIKKSTNGQDADGAPGPSIQVGAPVTWTYVVTNNGGAALNNVKVVDDKGVTVNCGAQTTLAAGASMTCTATGVATLGQYVNIGTATADTGGGSVSDRDSSHYLGVQAAEEAPAAKVQLCHRTGNGRYQPIEVSVSAEPAHRAHGDGKVGEAVPGNASKVFLPGCSVS